MGIMQAGLELVPEQQVRNLPRLIQANFLLQLSSQQIEQLIQTELSTNPALECMDVTTCPVCGQVMDATTCLTCKIDQDAAFSASLPDREAHATIKSVNPELDDDQDEFAFVAKDGDIRDEILADARAMLDEADHLLAEVVVEAVGDSGYLEVSVNEIAELSGCSKADVRRVLGAVQQCAPAGVAAESLQQCLSLQLGNLAREGMAIPPLVAEIVASHLTELAGHRYLFIARKLHSPVEDVQSAHEFIRRYLNPQPLSEQSAQHWRHTVSIPLVSPDAIITLDEDRLKVHIVGVNYDQLTINDSYRKLAKSLRYRRFGNDNNTAAENSISPDDRKHIQQSVSSARQFISRLQQRRETLLLITTAIVEFQEEFLRCGVRKLKPLTRSEVADSVGVHESTVSRATANKFVMLPNRQVIPYSDFFTPALNVKDVIKEIIKDESSSEKHLSDMMICNQLADRGYRIARRTVSKYRAELNILPSTIR